MNNRSKKVAVIIPAYNEGLVIGDVIKKARRSFKYSAYDIEIIVVNDGSSDDTAQKAGNAGATVINHIINTGAGGATATGIHYANQRGFSMAATMDADGQHDPDDVLRGLQEMEKSDTDLIIGSRLIDPEGMSRLKVLGNKGLSLITYLLFGINSTDSQSGLRIYSARALQSLRWEAHGYEFCSEMLWRAKQAKLQVKDYPIKAIYTAYSKAKGQSNWNAINILKSLLRQRILEAFQ